MARQPQPWPRKSQGNDWYTQIQGKQVFLAPATATKTEARRILNQILADTAKEGTAKRARGGPSVREVISAFLASVKSQVDKGERAQVTLDGYTRYLDAAELVLGKKRASALKPLDVQAWIDSKAQWNSTSRFNAATAIKAAFWWADDCDLIPNNPIKKLKRATPKSRKAILSHAQVDQILEIVKDEAFRDLLTAIRDTGCRPIEICTLTADRVDIGTATWRVTNKTRTTTGETLRTVYLTPPLVEMSRRLCERWPEGPIFRGRRKTPWTRHTISQRLRRLPESLIKLGPEGVVYSLRHLYITDALEKGIPPATVAQLVGHKDLTMIMRIYNQLHERTGHLRDAAQLIRPS